MKKPDLHTVVILVLILASTGHVGQLFAERESIGWGALGYVMALGIEAVSVISLYQMVVSNGSKRAVPLGVFLVVCVLLASLNAQYYRQNKPSDPLWFSVVLGASLPVLAALMSALRGLQVGTVEESERKHAESERRQGLDHELAMETIRQAEETKRHIAVRTAKETTATERARARQEEARATGRKAKETERKHAERQRQTIESLGNERATYDYYLEHPHADKATIAEAVGVTVKTVGNHHKRLKGLGLMGENGRGETT